MKTCETCANNFFGKNKGKGKPLATLVNSVKGKASGLLKPKQKGRVTTASTIEERAAKTEEKEVAQMEEKELLKNPEIASNENAPEKEGEEKILGMKKGTFIIVAVAVGVLVIAFLAWKMTAKAAV